MLAHWALGNLACGWDTSYCAASHEKDTTYRGQLTADDGRVLADTAFTVAFESRLDAPRVGGFTTDADGTYCLVWATEATTPLAYVDGTLAGRLEQDAEAPPGDCQTSDAEIPWNRADDLRSTPQFVGVFVPGALAILALVLGLLRPTRTSFVIGSALTAVTFALTVFVWFA